MISSLKEWLANKNIKPEGPIVIDGKSYKVNYKYLHEEVVHDLIEAKDNIWKLTDERFELLQKIDQLEADNSRMGNHLFDIVNCDTPASSGTTKKMASIAKRALGLA